MSLSMFAVFAISTLVSAAMWCSLRMAAASDLAVLPASCRKRLRWWQMNARHVYLVCATLALVTVLLQVHRIAL
jgi:hypothetical protein